MRTKLAACDPCRFAKLACDHARPVCGRCRTRDTESNCTYRARPFKKKRALQPNAQDDTQQRPLPDQDIADPGEDSVANDRPYPNPGYQGSSSHTTIFHQLSPVLRNENDDTQLIQGFERTLESSIDADQILEGAKLVEDIFKTIDVKSCRALIDDWTTNGGVNLALAGSLTQPCAQSTENALNQLDGLPQTFRELSKDLFVNSWKPITVDKSSTISGFLTNFCEVNIRWETVGLFLTAVSRATGDVTQFPLLFRSENQRRTLRRSAMRFADRCLDLALSLDCLNDLQLMLQYENFINHAGVDGDQSYHSWKRVGDVISSVFALGYHERIDIDGSLPVFLKRLRQAVAARVYSADKNLAIFLGRPPRMDYRYCKFDFAELPGSGSSDPGSGAIRYFGWNPDEAFEYVADTWWSFKCALLKEDIMHLQYEMDVQQMIQKASEIRGRAERLWLSLPHRYQYSGDLKLHHYKPIERDFVVSARLNYLHVLFLLRLTFMHQISEQDNELLNISAEMLHLVATAAVMKDRLSFSGTGLIWKICHYGMPPTGILCLSLLKQSFLTQRPGRSRATIIQDLSILVRQVSTGVLIDSSDPNYALLSAATRTIEVILNKTLSGELTTNSVAQQQTEFVSEASADDGNASWLPWSNNDSWDFELDFWTNLAEHPILIADETMT